MRLAFPTALSCISRSKSWWSQTELGPREEWTVFLALNSGRPRGASENITDAGLLPPKMLVSGSTVGPGSPHFVTTLSPARWFSLEAQAENVCRQLAESTLPSQALLSSLVLSQLWCGVLVTRQQDSGPAAITVWLGQLCSFVQRDMTCPGDGPAWAGGPSRPLSPPAEEAWEVGHRVPDTV